MADEKEATKKAPKPKEFNLSKEEKETLTSQRNLMNQHQYYVALIERDMRFFIHSEVKTRLGVKDDETITDWNIETGKIYVIKTPQKN